ncbi:MAG: AraC family transcriptional regulator [Chthoniobacterales bacterium]
MLIYMGRGTRTYGTSGRKINQRRCWEFQAVVSGSIRLVQSKGADVLKKNHLWLFPPHHAHDWVGSGMEPAEIVVFHFPSVPELVENMVRRSSHIETSLTKKQCARLLELAEEASRYWQRPSAGMTICYEHILMELSLLIVQAHTRQPENPRNTRMRQCVDKAINYYLEHMQKSPGLEDIAQEVKVSSSHLRRMFHEVLQESPQQVFDQLRFQRAIHLLSDATIKHERISELCGFDSGSAFSRAFKNRFGGSPRTWQA